MNKNGHGQIHLNAVKTRKPFSKSDSSLSCGYRPQQIKCSLWLQEIFGWPKHPARYLLLAQRASKILKSLISNRSEGHIKLKFHYFSPIIVKYLKKKIELMNCKIINSRERL